MLEAPVLTYVAEITTPEIRGLLAASASLCIILGVFSQFLMGLFIHWRIIAIVSTIAPVFAIIFLFFVPESPYWLIIKNREEDAKKSLMWLRGWLKNFDTVKQEFNQIEKSLKSSIDDDKETKNFKSFTNRSFLMPYLIVSLAFFIGHFSGMTTLQTYAVPIFAELKAPIDKYFATMLLGIVELSGTATCVILVRFVGKRKLTFISLVGCGLCFLSTAIYAYFIDKIPGKVAENNIISNVTRDSFNLSANSLELIATTTIESITIENFNSSIETSHEEIHSNQHSWIPLTLMLASAFLSHSGIRLLPWMLVGEVFPSKIRGVASGISGGTSYIFGFAANKTFLNMASTLTLSGTFLLYSCISIIGFIILLIILPGMNINNCQLKISKLVLFLIETEGRTLQEIEDHFNGNQKLSKTLKRKEVVIMSEIPESPTKFEISKTSAEKFENYLKEHHIEPTKLNPIKNHVEHRLKTEQKNGKKVVFNDDDYDTSL